MEPEPVPKVTARSFPRLQPELQPGKARLHPAARHAYDPDAPPPEFGEDVRKYWAFEEGYVNVNHGAWGV